MGRNYALTVPQMRRAAELYQDGKSRREVARLLDVSEGAVKNALRLQGVRMRERKAAAVMGLARWSREKRRQASAFRPAVTTYGPWVWMNPANADRWMPAEAFA